MMTASRQAQRAARRRGELHRDGGDPRVPQAIAARGRLNTERVGRGWIDGREVGSGDSRPIRPPSRERPGQRAEDGFS
jgi:hypothetical protein